MKRIYADNAATTKMSRIAIDAMLPFLEGRYGNPSSLYAFGQDAKEALEDARSRVARCIGAETPEIYFTGSGTESINQAIVSAARLGERKGRKHLISTRFEHHAVLHTLERLRKEGFELTLLEVYENGVVKPEDVKAAIRPETCLVSVMYVNNEIGTIQPIPEIGAICKEKGVFFHTDAVQASGHLHIDVKEQNIDMLSMSAHKFNGPKGVGALYVRKGIVIANIVEGGAQERGKRGGTENVAGIVSMAAALEDACAHIDEHAEKQLVLRNRLIEGLSKIPHSILNGDRTHRVSNNVNFCFEGVEGESLLLLLDDKGICASSGSACTSGSLEPSHVLLAIGRPHEVSHGSLRLSFNHEFTEEDIDYIIASVKEVVEYLRSISPFWHEMESGKMPHLI